MRAGSLRDRVGIQRRTTSRDAAGAVLIAWETYATVWAAVEPLSGREAVAMKEVHASANVRVTLRWRKDLRAQDRLLFVTRVFEINGITDVGGRQRWLELACTEDVT